MPAKVSCRVWALQLLLLDAAVMVRSETVLQSDFFTIDDKWLHGVYHHACYMLHAIYILHGIDHRSRIQRKVEVEVELEWPTKYIEIST